MTFTGDTTCFPPFGDFAKGLDVLVHEAMLPAGIGAILQRTGGGQKLRAHLNASHFRADDAGRIAAMAGGGRLLLTHLVPVGDERFTVTDWLRTVAATDDRPCPVGHGGRALSL